LVLAVYLDAVLPTKGFGVPPSHPLLCLHREQGCCAGRSNEARTDVEEDLNENTVLDESVQAEKQRVLQGDASNAAVVISNLCKRFKKKKERKNPAEGAVHAHLREWAVDHLYLSINQGECFGLLGENGAGKTTAISMLTGLLEVTSGTALFQGYNLRYRRHMQQIHKLIGVCPQFDTLWPSLTPEEHLLFFTRLRGTVPQNKEREHVDELLKLFELDGKRKHKLSKQLSGGMRRRLSVGIALAGDSKIVFLDEPSTGLDPRSRRLLWDIILKFREKGDRSIVLTTHSMDEADVLCSRIGIMMRGQLRCVGSSLELKRRFGFGYRLTVSFAPENKQAAIEDVERLVPSAVAINNYDYTNAVSYQVSESEILHSPQLIEELEHCKQRGVIHDWELNQTSLEDVFLNVVSRKQDDV
jgi:ABC-type multidrug transport system ATPase subunit